MIFFPDKNTCKVRIGAYSLKAPLKHTYTLPLPSLYDKGPWLYICDLANGLDCYPSLIDIGANIGDSAAWWRTFSKTKVICIEPSDIFYSLLAENIKLLGNCLAYKRLYNAGFKKDELIFRSGRSTGSTVTSGDSNGAEGSYEGDTISIREILDVAGAPCVLKTDTDGFDSSILNDIVSTLKRDTPTNLPIIFTEGPSKLQFRSGDFGSFVDAFRSLIELGYNCTVFSNFGSLYAYTGSSFTSLESVLTGMQMSLKNKRPPCGYFDFVFSRSDLDPTPALHNLRMRIK